jgi:ribosomal protein S18 acetylase RimI-like enzyme
MLMAAADAFARQHGAIDVRVGAMCGNESAEGLYRALGFRPYLQIFSNAANGQERPVADLSARRKTAPACLQVTDLSRYVLAT